MHSELSPPRIVEAPKPKAPPSKRAWEYAKAVLSILYYVDRVDICVLAGLWFVFSGIRLWSEALAMVAVGAILLLFAMIGARKR